MSKKSNRRHLINKKVLQRRSKNSNIVRHALRELELAGYFKANCGTNKLMKDDIVELLTVFADQGHSGSSAQWCINLFKKLANFEIISPLTLKDDEFNLCSLMENVYQNKRKSTIFKDSKGIHNIDAFSKRVVDSYKFDTKTWDRIKQTTLWSGGVWGSEDGLATGNYYSSAYLKDATKPYTPIETIILNCWEVEVAKDDFMDFVCETSPEFIDLIENYTLQPSYVKELEGVHITAIDAELCHLAENQLKLANK